jgi:hypothetical protein
MKCIARMVVRNRRFPGATVVNLPTMSVLVYALSLASVSLVGSVPVLGRIVR